MVHSPILHSITASEQHWMSFNYILGTIPFNYMISVTETDLRSKVEPKNYMQTSANLYCMNRTYTGFDYKNVEVLNIC